MTKTNLSGVVLALAAAVVTLPTFAADKVMRLLPAQGDDLVATQLEQAKIAVPADIERAPVSFAWALDASPLAAARPFVAESTEYWTTVDGAELAKGLAIRTTAPGAVVRISPAGGANKAMDPLQVSVRAGGVTYTRGSAFATSSNAAELKAASAPFPEGTVAFKLRADLGVGTVDIALANARGNYLVHVFEPDSGERLSLTTNRATLLSGQAIEVEVDYASASAKALGRVGGAISAPNGQLTDLAFARGTDGRWRASVQPDVVAGAGAGLWEVHTFATTADGTVQRDARTAFNAAPATARFTGDARLADAKAAQGGVQVAVGVEVAAASRYNASGVLYGTDARGQLVPAAIAHAAAWLGAGSQALTLRFDASLVAGSGLRAPFELRDLTLVNQANQGTLERRERALRLAE